MHTDRCGNTRGRKCRAKGSGKKQIQEFMYRDTKNVEHEMHDITGNNWSHRNSNKRLTKNLEGIPREHSIDSLQKDITYNSEYITFWNFKLEWWGSPLAQ